MKTNFTSPILSIYRLIIAFVVFTALSIVPSIRSFGQWVNVNPVNSLVYSPSSCNDLGNYLTATNTYNRPD